MSTPGVRLSGINHGSQPRNPGSFTRSDGRLLERLSKAHTFGQQLLEALNRSSAVGCAILDADLKYEYINPALAHINGFPLASHIGKSLEQVLGDVAKVVAPKIQYVLNTGSALTNVEISAILRGRSELGTWMEEYFPLTNRRGQVTHVIVIVVEVPRRTELLVSVPSNSSIVSITSSSLAVSSDRMLRSWKEIAKYLSASVRTVQRWERGFELPVRRLKAKKGMEVMAFTRDLEKWLERRSPYPVPQ